MKILIINVIQYNINGIANIILSHIKSLKSVNEDFEIAVTSYGELDNFYVGNFSELGVGVIKVPSRQKLFLYSTELRKIITNNNFDVIHIHGNSGTMALEARIAKKYSNARVIVHLHNSTCSHPKLFGPDSLLTKIMKKNADCLVACSKLAGDWLYKDNYIVLSNAIDLERFAFDEQKRKLIREQYNIPEHTFVIGHVGVFNEQKNHEFLLKAFAEYLKINSNSRLLLVGDGVNKGRIVSLAKTLNIEEKVIFAGIQQDMPAYYSAFDIFVFPSLWEGLPIVTVEIQANGLPAICSLAVSSEIAMSERFILKDLKDGVLSWARQIEEIRAKYKDRDAPISELCNAGYNISDQGNRLMQIYRKS